MALRTLMATIGVPTDQAEKIVSSPLVQELDQQVTTVVKQKAKRKLSKYDKMLSKALEELNSKLRLKNGQLRKGITQADLMRRAHKLAKRMMK